MNEELLAQRKYWNNEADAFESIYTHRKSKFSNMLDNVFRKDMYERFVFTIKNCEPIPDRTFLDVGCENGLYSLELARKEARKKENLADRCEFIQTDLLAYDSNEKFDVSFGIGLFDYIKDPVPVLKK